MQNRTDYSAESAIEDLNNYPERFNKPEAFKDLVRGISVDTPGNVTLLYSGMLNADVSSNNLALALARQDKDLRLIDTTEAAKFLASDECINAVANIHGTTPKKVREDYTDPGNKFLFDGKEGLWAATSERFVRYTTTELVTATPYARGDRVFAQVELKEALNNKVVPSINGVPIEVFKQVYKTTGSLEEVNKAVAASSYDRMQGMQVAVMNARVTAVDTGSFIDRPTPVLTADQRLDLKPLLDPAKAIEFADGRKLMVDARIKLKTVERKDDLVSSLAKDVPHISHSEKQSVVKAKSKAVPQESIVDKYIPKVGADGKLTVTISKVEYNLSNAEKPAKSAATRSFEGLVIHVDKKHVYQIQENEREKARVIRHDLKLYSRPPLLGTQTKVDYLRGAGNVIGREHDLQR
jgi:hypothetical protein